MLFSIAALYDAPRSRTLARDLVDSEAYVQVGADRKGPTSSW